MKIYLEKLSNKHSLTFEESKTAFEILMSGKASDDEIFNFLTLLSAKGEVASEIAGGVHVLRNKSKRVNVDNCIDTCGTGGDGKNTLNISTASALLLSSIGVKVAKHGNKAVSSKCGSGDVLDELKVKKQSFPSARFAFIAPIQSRKFQTIMDYADEIHSIRRKKEIKIMADSSWCGNYFIQVANYISKF